jgi:hypothetical protein
MVLALCFVALSLQAAAERQLREQGQLAAAASAGADAAAEAPAADAPAEPAAAAGDAAADGDAAGASGAGQGGKKGKASAKDKEEALLKAKRKEIMERAGGSVGQLAEVRYHQPISPCRGLGCAVGECMMCSRPIKTASKKWPEHFFSGVCDSGAVLVLVQPTISGWCVG